MRFLRRLFNYDIIDSMIESSRLLAEIGYQHVEIIEDMKVQMTHMNLDRVRHNCSMLEQFLIELDHPERQEDLRETLTAAISDLNDEIARIEEHVA